MITLEDYWMGRDKQFAQACTLEIQHNAIVTVARANILLAAYAAATGDTAPRKVNSGWRPPSINAATFRAAPNSKHLTAQAVDLDDPEGDLDAWCLANPEQLAAANLWLEHPSATKGWCHVQTIPPRSGNRVFYP